ncbi:MAG TPA: hypothetical protein VNC50_05655, partial [Planctomycetia bacterium]|nr:hypothetical protein [Planctomycetia bacterium]
EGTDGVGRWIAADPTNQRFGGPVNSLPVLQKGDNFNVPQFSRKPQRLMPSWLKGAQPLPEHKFTQTVRRFAETPADSKTSTGADPKKSAP